MTPSPGCADRPMNTPDVDPSRPLRIEEGEDSEVITRATLSHYPASINESGSDDDLTLD